MTAYGEEAYPLSFSQGLYTADLPSAIPENYCAVCDNAIPTGTSVESRFGFQKANVAFNELARASELLPAFSHFGPTGDENNPVIMWGSDQNGASPRVHLIREGEPFTDPGGGSTVGGYFSVGIAADFVGAVNYNGTFYMFLTNQVYKITNINWGTSSYTITSIVGSPGSMAAPVHFLDRLWTAKDNTLYWTDAIVSPGALPETWNIGTNFLKVVGRNGPGKIYKLIPLGSRIYIFTSQGLFSLTVAGSPSDWYIRPIDEKAIVNSYECAFEIGGMIYYICIYGVFVTNGGDSLKLSGPIENNFLAGNFESGSTSTSKRSNIYRINYMDGGMIISISNLFMDVGVALFDVVYCHNYYTRLANIAWSKWDYNTGAGEPHLAAVVSIADSVESYINKAPLSYVMVLTTNSTVSDGRDAQRELMVYDGLKDVWTNPSGGGSITTKNVEVHLKTRYFDGGNVVQVKAFKYAFLNMYLSDKTKANDSNYWAYSWLTESHSFDGTPDVALINPADIYGEEFNSLKLASSFQYRILQFEIVLNTQDTVNYKLKDLVLKQDTSRDGPFSIQ